MRNRALLLTALFLALTSPVSAAERTVIVMLFDGLASALVADNPTPNLDRIASEGAWTHGMVPAFPTTSLVNGVTISTGCWPAQHGIVANRFHDPERGEYDHSKDADWKLGCEHLHEAAERQGVRTAALDWYGARSSTRGDLASDVDAHEDFSQQPLDRDRAAQVIDLLKRPAHPRPRKPERQVAPRPRLILAYFRGPDSSAHFNGMDADETREAVVETDARVGEILAAIDVHPNRKNITLIITTDHGMRPVEQIVNVSRIMRRHDIDARAISDGSAAYLYFEDKSAISAAKQALDHYDEFDIYEKTALPDWARIGSGPRVGDLILSAHPPYFTADVDLWPAYARWLGTIGPDFVPALGNLYATHGYAPDTPGMHGVFYATGAGIASGRQVEQMRAIDIHPTVTHLLGIAPGQPVDGGIASAFLAAPER